MGFQILIEALRLLSDTADPTLAADIRAAAEKVDGVLAVAGVRTRWMSSNVAMADCCIMVGPLSTASSAQKLSGQVREAAMRANPSLTEVLVRTQTMCPLLDATSPSPSEHQIEAQVENVLMQRREVGKVRAVRVRYINGGELAVDVEFEFAHEFEAGATLGQLRESANDAQKQLLGEVEGLRHASLSSHLCE
jgi:divalent metal cation (Fe/Co/Zn/Cd) transporter